MAAKLNNWCKTAKKTMIDLDMSVKELAARTGLTRPYCSSVLNGKIYSETAIKKISSCLNILPTEEPLRY